eukprot:5185063-Amphidinium_carterae.1
MPENQKLYRRSQKQKYEAIWIGKDTTTGQHITFTTEFGRQLARTILRLPKEQQFDKTMRGTSWCAWRMFPACQQ